MTPKEGGAAGAAFPRGCAPRLPLVGSPVAVAKPGMIVFDMDGVLVDVTASFQVAITRTVEALGGGAVGREAIQGLKNAGGFNNDWDLSRELLRRAGVEVERERVIEVFNRFYLGPGLDGEGGLIQDEAWLLPGELLEAAGARYRLAIFTGRPRADARYTLRKFGVEGAFAHVLGLEDVTRQKPDPEGLRRLQGRQPEGEIVAYVGDTVDDARCAAAAGVPFFAVLAAGLARRAELEAEVRRIGCAGMATQVAAVVEGLVGAEVGRI